MPIFQKPPQLRTAERCARWPSYCLAALVAAGILLASGTPAQAQRPAPTAAVFPPPHHTNAWFIDQQTGQPKYLVAAFYVTQFLGVPAVGGVWTDGVRVEAWAAVPTAVPGTWVWLVANGGPAGTLFPATSGPYPGGWQDNKGNSGGLFTTP